MSLVGGNQVFGIIIGLIRTKIIAVLLGPAGIGLFALYQSIVDLVRSISGLGINFSSVKDISQAKDDTELIYIVSLVRKISIVTGVIGLLCTIFFSRYLSKYTFDDTNHVQGILVISLSVYLTSISAVFSSIFQGVRRLDLLVKSSILSALISLIFTVPLIYLFGESGVVWSIVLGSIVTFFISLIYFRKLNYPLIAISLKDSFVKGKSMIKLGFFMIIASTIGIVSMYIVRVFILRNSTLDHVGEFNAAWSIGSMYLMLVLNAMASDYFPRLSKVIDKPDKVVNLVLNQLNIALLIGGTIIIGFLIYIDLVISMLYTKSFFKTVEVLFWILIGDFFKLISWPLSYVLLSKNKGTTHVILELTWNFFFLLIGFYLWNYSGIVSFGQSYAISNFLFSIATYYIIRKEINVVFKWKEIKIILVFIMSIIVIVLSKIFLDKITYYFLCSTYFICLGCYTLFQLREVLGISNFKIWKKV